METHHAFRAQRSRFCSFLYFMTYKDNLIGLAVYNGHYKMKIQLSFLFQTCLNTKSIFAAKLCCQISGKANKTFGHANSNFSVFIDGIRNQFLKNLIMIMI